MRFNLKSIALATTLALTTLSVAAVDLSTRRPAQHNAEHKDLLAYQTNVTEQIKLKETLDYMDNMFKEEEEPELDIYTEGWDSQLVNAYTNSVVPESKVIDVTISCMPILGLCNLSLRIPPSFPPHAQRNRPKSSDRRHYPRGIRWQSATHPL